MIPAKYKTLCKTCEDQLRRPGSAYCIKCAKDYNIVYESGTRKTT